MNRSVRWVGSVALALIVGGVIGHWMGGRGSNAPTLPAAPTGQAAYNVPSAKTEAPSDRKVLYWHDPMAPGQKFDKPGKSPFMDMQLVPVYADEAAGGGVSVSPAMTGSLGIRTVVARKMAMATRLDVVGNVAENERASAVVQARTSGYIEKLYARANFDSIAAGAPVALIYSPEWAGAQAEYLALRRARAEAPLVAAARQRLRLLVDSRQRRRERRAQRCTGGSLLVDRAALGHRSRSRGARWCDGDARNDADAHRELERCLGLRGNSGGSGDGRGDRSQR